MATSRCRSGSDRRARRPRASPSAFTVAAFASGTNGAAFQFLPDGRILLGERNGVIRIVGTDGKLSDPLAGMPPDMAKAGQSRARRIVDDAARRGRVPATAKRGGSSSACGTHRASSAGQLTTTWMGSACALGGLIATRKRPQSAVAA